MSDQEQSLTTATVEWSFCFDALNEAASSALASDLARIVTKGDCLALDGDLGLGKSSFARALLRARAEDPFLEVPSPTFTLMQDYAFEAEQGSLTIGHFDLYRISDVEELFEIGLEESWQTGCALIEWPDRAEELLPESTLWLHFELAEGDTRRLTLSGPGLWADRLSRLCPKRAFLNAAQWGDAVIRPLKGDLSPRSYDRVLRSQGSLDSPSSAILMDMPARAPGPELGDGRLYDLVAHRVTHLAPMVSICEGLEELGLRVPRRFGTAFDEGLMLWEDFGSKTLADGPEEPVTERYLAVVACLAKLHDQEIPQAFGGTGGLHRLPRYDRDAFLVELDVFLDHYWPHIRNAPCPSAERAAFQDLWQPLVDRLTGGEQTLVLRDVQDPNCFWLGGDAPGGAVGFIDFQDCLIGPSAYDLAALAMDARVTIPDALEREMLASYKSLRSLSESDAEAFEASYALCAAQRISKNLGAFARAANQLDRPHYLDHVSRSLGYLAKALGHPLLLDLKDWYVSRGLIS